MHAHILGTCLCKKNERGLLVRGLTPTTHCTVVVHHVFPKGKYLKTSVPHPKIDVGGKKTKVLPDKKSHGLIKNEINFLRHSNDYSDDFELRRPPPKACRNKSAESTLPLS